MTERTYGNVCVMCNEQGYLTDLTQWDKSVGEAIATEEEIAMSDKHWEVVGWIQTQFRNKVPLTIRKVVTCGAHL